MAEPDWFDCKHNDEIVCPHCGYEFTDSWDCMSGDSGNLDCDDCGKEFFCEATNTRTYSTCKPTPQKGEAENEC